MVADRQRKVRLLAIEEEMARLEVEMLIEMRSGYLGMGLFKSSKADIDRFVTRYLNPTLSHIGLGEFSQDPNISTVCNRFKSREFVAMAGGKITPTAIWQGVVGDTEVYVFFRVSLGKGSWYVFRASDIGQLELKESDFVEIWATDAVESEAVLFTKQRPLGEAIQIAAGVEVVWPPYVYTATSVQGTVRPSNAKPTPSRPAQVPASGRGSFSQVVNTVRNSASSPPRVPPPTPAVASAPARPSAPPPVAAPPARPSALPVGKR